MAEKNEETERAFIDYLESVIGPERRMAFHLLIRRMRMYSIRETARGYASNARDILGNDQDLIRRFLESVPLPRDVETILSDPFYDYQGDRGESMFWGYAPPRYITDAQRAEMRKRKSGGWSEAPPAKRIAPDKKVDDPNKKDEDEAYQKVRPGTSKSFQSDDQAIPCCSKSVKMYELSSSSSELAIEEDNSGDDGQFLTDEGIDASESNNQTEKSCAEGAKTDGSFSESTKEEDNYGEYLEVLEGGSDNSGSFHSDYQAIPSGSDGEHTDESLSVSSESVNLQVLEGGSDSGSLKSDYQAIPSGSDGEHTDENLSVSSESVKEADSNEDDGDVPLELSVHSSESLNSSNEAKQLFSEEEGTDEHSGDSRESAKEGNICEDGEILEDSDNSGSIHSDNQAPLCSDGEETGDERNSPEY